MMTDSLDIYLENENLLMISFELAARTGRAYNIIVRIYGFGNDVMSGEWKLPAPVKIS